MEFPGKCHGFAEVTSFPVDQFGVKEDSGMVIQARSHPQIIIGVFFQIGFKDDGTGTDSLALILRQLVDRPLFQRFLFRVGEQLILDGGDIIIIVMQAQVQCPVTADDCDMVPHQGQVNGIQKCRHGIIIAVLRLNLHHRKSGIRQL